MAMPFLSVHHPSRRLLHLRFSLAAIAGALFLPSIAWCSPASPDDKTASPDLSTAKLDVPPRRLFINLMMEGRLAWFSWMRQQHFKPKLVVDWSRNGRDHTRTWQHGVDGSEYPQAYFLMRGDDPGDVRWGALRELGSSREAHKHHFFCKETPSRCAFLKADISEIPPDAAITRTTLVLHIHDTEGLKAVPGGDGTGRFRHVNKDWDWDHITFTHYAEGRPWTTPIDTYPFLGDGDVSPVLWSLHRQKDLAERGYHKRGERDYPLDITPYVRRLQQLRSRQPRHVRRPQASVARIPREIRRATSSLPQPL